ncbi:OmpA family protein [uncultured Treponema sp.]|uniref:OmpA family protein n=1 Tax=uncultured Treponema sp. TaxID=162155 RepID=UPI0025847EA6|nr:OmpA family protein [uncultured Treponema sp.]
MKRKILLISVLLIFASSFFAHENSESVKFEFKYQKGDRYRILSTVDEDIFVNHRKSHHSIIVNRVSAEITDVTKDGQGIHDCIFMTTEDSTGTFTGARFSYGKDYKSIFKRSKNGTYTIADEYFMPTVRDVPIFPDREILPGEKWTAKGHEAHDLRKGFGIEKPYKVPFNAEYTYEGRDENSGLYKIRVRYTMYMENPPVQNYDLDDYPVTTRGFSDETIFWDNEKGSIDHYSESFKIFIETAAGNIFEFRGTAHAEVTEFARTNTTENISSVQKKIKELGLENVTVKPDEKGLTIAIENIQFEPDSAILLESEKIKIQQIAKILENWPDNDILVTGHTALAGTEKMRKILSEERASTVAEYLIGLNVRDRFHVFTQGFGAERPIATNRTEEGKARNRRVEITIMDK